MRGLLIRSGLFLFGAVPLTSLLHIFDASSELAGIAVILYAAAGANYLGHYCVKHQDEIPPRSQRP
jgi:hypothetical protein